MSDQDPPDRDAYPPAGARPSGVPLGRAFLIRQSPLNDDLIVAVRAVASVHGDGPLPSIPLRHDSSLNEVRGRFWFDDDGPIAILINPTFAYSEFATVHEIGHSLDFSGLGEAGSFASESAEELAPWRQAVLECRRTDELRRATERIARTQSPARAAAQAVTLTSSELWARSYAQYLTLLSGDPRLLMGLETSRSPVASVKNGIGHLLHWQDDEFAPVADAVEALSRKMGWRSGP